MVEKLDKIYFPKHFDAVNLPEDSAGRKEVLRQYSEGPLCLVFDPCHCIDNQLAVRRIRVDDDDNQCYYLQMLRSSGEIYEQRAHYNDLEKLFVAFFSESTGIRHQFK